MVGDGEGGGAILGGVRRKEPGEEVLIEYLCIILFQSTPEREIQKLFWTAVDQL